jgi:hypothetical protein
VDPAVAGRLVHAPPVAGRTDAAAAPPAEQEPVAPLPQVVDRSAAAFDHLEQRDTNGMVAVILTTPFHDQAGVTTSGLSCAAPRQVADQLVRNLWLESGSPCPAR